jgi:hypothetical protein
VYTSRRVLTRACPRCACIQFFSFPKTGDTHKKRAGESLPPVALSVWVVSVCAYICAREFFVFVKGLDAVTGIVSFYRICMKSGNAWRRCMRENSSPSSVSQLLFVVYKTRWSWQLSEIKFLAARVESGVRVSARIRTNRLKNGMPASIFLSTGEMTERCDEIPTAR